MSYVGMRSEPQKLPHYKISYCSHIDEVFSDYKKNRVTLTEVSDHMKAIVADLIDSLCES